MSEDQDEIIDCLSGIPVVVHVKLAHPVQVIRRRRRGVLRVTECISCRLHPFLVQQVRHLMVRECQTAHLIKGWHFRCRRPFLHLIVLVTELMQADHIPGVDQLAAARVRGVVTVCEQVAVVEHQAPDRGPSHVGVSVRAGRWFVYSREELLHGRRHRIHPAEGADDSLLIQRVFLPGNLPPDRDVPIRRRPL